MEYVIKWQDVKRKAGIMLDIESIFSYHAATNAAVLDLHQDVRDVIKSTAGALDEWLPDSPEKTLAIRHLQQAMMFANSAIAQYIKE
jgi:hypothetical protein